MILKKRTMETRFADLPTLQSSVVAALVLFVITTIAFIWLVVVYFKRKRAGSPDDSNLYIDCAYFCEIGKRPSQQDSVYISDLTDYRKYGITALVADGMGGMEYGGEISEKVADFVEGMCPMSFFATEQNADELRKLSNQLYDQYKLSGGSTLAMVHITGNFMNYYSVGDSDIILIREGKPTILNPRQNYMALLIKSLCRNNKQTVTAYSNPKARSLIDFMGNQNPRVIYTKKPIRIFDGDKIIVSSDGLTDAVALRNIHHYLKDSASATALELKRAVASRKRPKQDNYTAIVFTVKRSFM
ncbi:MAG: protein phosphatase 2C domain-containing protein [Clostridiales bacterium]|nr:protein phosphatase 2C domain-containing protein [Clostridiales bacterium]